MRKPNPRFPIEREDIERVMRRFYRVGPTLDIIGPQIEWELETYGEQLVDKIIEFWVEVILYNNINFVPTMQMSERSRRSRIDHTHVWFAELGKIMDEELNSIQAVAWQSLQQGVFTNVMHLMRQQMASESKRSTDGPTAD